MKPHDVSLVSAVNLRHQTYVSRAGVVQMRPHHDCIDLGISSRTWASWTDFWRYKLLMLVCPTAMLLEHIEPNFKYVHQSAKPLHQMCAVHACHHQDAVIKLESHRITKTKWAELASGTNSLLKHAWHTRVVLFQSQFHSPFAPLQRHPRQSAANVEPWHASWNPGMRQAGGKQSEISKKGSWNIYLWLACHMIKLRLGSWKKLH